MCVCVCVCVCGGGGGPPSRDRCEQKHSAGNLTMVGRFMETHCGRARMEDGENHK